VKEYVPMWTVGQLLGTTLPVLVDRADRRRLVVDWPTAQPAAA
jgi:hypothetical protein